MSDLPHNGALTETFAGLPLPWEPAGENAPAIDGRVPYATCAPKSADEIANLLAWADNAGMAVIPTGAGTKLDQGNPPRRADLLLVTRELGRVVEYEPANLTVTVEAGVSLASLQRTLGERGQWLPLDPPFAASATPGGIVATNASGPRRLGYGSARDLVIGTIAVLPDGRIVRAGGKVVKNVAGYDLNKLYIGSLGTLAVIAEITFKVAPLPPTEQTLVARFRSLAGARSAVHRVLSSPLMPTAVELVNPTAARVLASVEAPLPDDGIVAIFLAAGAPGAVQRQLQEIDRICTEGEADERVTYGDETSAALWRRIAEFAGDGAAEQRLRLKVSVPLAEIGRALDAVEQAGRSADANPAVVAHAGSGILYAAWGALPNDASVLRTIVEATRNAVRGSGSVVVEKGPIALKSAIDVWGYDGDALAVMRRIKEEFDPRGILNPGRFVGGI